MSAFDKNKYPAIGAAVLNIDSFNEFVENEKKADQVWIERNWREYFNTHQSEGIFNAAEFLYNSWRPARIYDGHVKKVTDLDSFLKTHDQTWLVHYEDEELVILSGGEIAFAVPNTEDMVQIAYFKNLDAVKPSDFYKLGDTQSPFALASIDDKSKNDLKSDLENKKSEIEDQKAAIKAKEQEMKDEIEAMKKKIMESYQSKFDELNTLKSEAERQMKEIEQKIFILDTALYGIRCFMGEVINFTQITDGKAADIDTPVVLYQKLRYLDEEMAKYAAIYNFNGEDLNLFEDVLKYREDIRGLFAPGPKSISLVRVSRDNTAFGIHPEIANILEKYEVYHGKQIGILIRNGKKLYMGWTDESRVSMAENMFYANGTEKEESLEDAESLQSDSKETIASRYFIFQILQGVITNDKLLSLPKGTSIYQNSPYIVFSMADAWLPDNKYGNFSDILKRTDKPMKKGDMILTTINIRRDDAYQGNHNRRWDNNRGIGAANRTHDAAIPDRTAKPVNVVRRFDYFRLIYDEYEAVCSEEPQQLAPGVYSHSSKETYTRTDKLLNKDEYDNIDLMNFVFKDHHFNKEYDFKGCTFDEIAEWLLRFYQERYTDEDEITWSGRIPCYRVPTAVEYRTTEYEYYISAEKEGDYWSDKRPSFANMQIYTGEYINLTYLNSVYVKYAIANRKADNLYIGGKRVNFKTALPYLQKALEYLEKREEEEAKILRALGMELYPDWQVDVSEWRLEHEYHSLTKVNAKKFVKEKMI